MKSLIYKRNRINVSTDNINIGQFHKSYDITYMQNLKKMIQMNLFTKQKQIHRFREWIYGYWGEEQEGGTDRQFEIDVYRQGGLVYCGSQGRKESDTTEQLNWTEL